MIFFAFRGRLPPFGLRKAAFYGAKGRERECKRPPYVNGWLPVPTAVEGDVAGGVCAPFELNNLTTIKIYVKHLLLFYT